MSEQNELFLEARKKSNPIEKDWYSNRIVRGSATFDTIQILRDRPIKHKKLIGKLIDMHVSNPYKYLKDMEKRNLIGINNKRVELTDKGLLLYTAAVLGLSPLSFMILSFAQHHVSGAGFFIKNYKEYNPIGQPQLPKRHMRDAFTQLVKKGFVVRMNYPGVYTIPKKVMERLSKYDDILSKSEELTRYAMEL